jgi:hypothetical protein
MSVALEHVEPIAAPAGLVWPFVRWDNLEAMREGGFFLAVAYEERRPLPGAIRVVTLADGGRLVERLDCEDAANRRLAYTMLETGNVPIVDYRGEVVVTPMGDADCAVRFASVCTPVGMDAAAWRAAWTGMQVANAAFIRTRALGALAGAQTVRQPG